MSTTRGSNFPWTALPRRMTPKPMPSWIAPRKISSMMPSVRVPVDAKRPRTQAPPAPAEAELAPASTHDTKINVLQEESPELEALRQQNAQLEQTLAETISEGVRMRKQILEASEKDLVKLSVAIAEQVVGRELRANPDLVVTWAKLAIDQLAKDEDVTIAISPEVEPLLSAEKWGEFFPAAIVVVDDQLEPGRTQIRSKSTRVGAGRVDR
jgi:flagellar biosynthesis/type III secretory pathway protein FliH